MKRKENQTYMDFIITVAFLLADVVLLAIMSYNALTFAAYLVINICFIGAYCAKKTATDTAVFAILFMLFYSLFTDIFIHYLGIKVVLEAQFLYLLPLTLACLKKKGSGRNNFLLVCAGYFVLNLIILLLNRKVDIGSYLKFLVNLVTFVEFFYFFQKCRDMEKMTALYKFIFALSCLMTVVQAAVGFHVDTRNGVFSVFGFGAYTIFIMIFAVYHITQFISQRESLRTFVFAILICSVIYILTEAKAAIVIMFANIVIIAMVKSDIPARRRLLIIALGIAMVPIAYAVLLKFNPKFSYLTTPSAIFRYYFGNNNLKYEYGRFEAIRNVFMERDLLTKLFGVGFGASTPLYQVFYNELGREITYPYYIRQYGLYYGYQHTSISTLLLDGGLLLSCPVVFAFVAKILKTAKKVYRKEGGLTVTVQFGVMVYLLYYCFYASIFKDFRAMAITAIVFGITSMETSKTQEKIE